MSSSADPEFVPEAGSSTDEHVTRPPETGRFITDEEPTPYTPAHGSSNAGINELQANRIELDDADGGRASREHGTAADDRPGDDAGNR